MKTWLAVLAVLLLLPIATAQDPVTTRIAEDASGDAKVEAQGQSSPPPADRFTTVDLRTLEVTETPDDFIVHIGVASLAPQFEAPGEGSTLYLVHFLQHDKEYRLRVMRHSTIATFYSARLESFDPGRGGYSTLQALEVTADPATHVISVVVPRQAIVDNNGAAPHPQFPITGFRATSAGFTTAPRNNKVAALATASVTVTDRMPDVGNATTDLQVSFGVRQSGHARLYSDIPTRASNGEATTFVFQVKAQNRGLREDVFRLTTTATPSGWTVKMPATQVSIPANGSVLLPVLVTTPFTHSHGAFQNFVLEMTSTTDSSAVGRVQLGIRYSQPAQPAGHHPTLWFHSHSAGEDEIGQLLLDAFGAGASLYMNAEENDPTDEAVDVAADSRRDAIVSGSPSHVFTWEIPLSPGLEMGLDFDLARLGQLQVPVKTAGAAPGAVLSGQLVHYSAPQANGSAPPGLRQRGAPLVLADVTPTSPRDLQGGETVIDAELVPRPESDFVRYQRGASLVLVLNLTVQRPDPGFLGALSPTIRGGTVTLPLFEYHDPVDDIFLSDVELMVTSRQDRFANPGQTVLFNLTLANRGDAAATYEVDLAGTNLAWARMLPASRTVVVPAGATYNFAVVVSVPKDVAVPTSPGVEKPAADLILSATNQADFNQRALVRLHTSVDKAPRTDDSELVAQLEKDLSVTAKSPALGLAALLAVGLVAAFGRSRARQE